MRPRDVPTAAGILMSMICFVSALVGRGSNAASRRSHGCWYSDVDDLPRLRAAEPQPLLFHVRGPDRIQTPIPPFTRNPNGSAACQPLISPRSGIHGALRKHVGLLGASPYQT